MSNAQFTAFAESLGLEMTAQSVATRPDMVGREDEWHKDASHFLVTLTRLPEGADPERSPNVVWTGFYSTGAAHPLIWARKAAKTAAGRTKLGYQGRQAVQHLRDYRGYGARRSLFHDQALQALKGIYRAKAPLDIGDVLISLQCDSREWEATFEDWCANLGYDTDSRKALEIFEACQNTAKTLLRALGREHFDSFMRLEEE